MAGVLGMLDDLVRGQERLAQHVSVLTQTIDSVVAGLSVVGQEIRAQRGEIREQREEIREQREEIREHRKEAGELRLLIGRVLDRFDRLIEGEIADLRRRIERLEHH
jgi:uncharacterized coiled-coil DUF342 family protein